MYSCEEEAVVWAACRGLRVTPSDQPPGVTVWRQRRRWSWKVAWQMQYFILVYVLWQWGALPKREWALSRGVMWVNLGFGKITLLTAKTVSCNYAPRCHPGPSPCPHYFLPHPARQDMGWLCLFIISSPPYPNGQTSHSHSDTVQPCLVTCGRALLPTVCSSQNSTLLLFGPHLCPSWPLPQMQTFLCHTLLRRGLVHLSWKVGSTLVTIAVRQYNTPLLKLLPSRWAIPLLVAVNYWCPTSSSLFFGDFDTYALVSGHQLVVCEVRKIGDPCFRCPGLES